MESSTRTDEGREENAKLLAEEVAENNSEDAQLQPYETKVYDHTLKAPGLPVYRARNVVTRRQLEERLPRSAPDAFRYEPGIYVQQTAHGQGSPYMRGQTGQQVLIMFDGIRLNNSIYREGPNQYFFTVDNQSIASHEAIRGGASTHYGSDAIGGVLLATPMEPSFYNDDETHVRATAMARAATADDALGGRVSTDVALGPTAAFIAGAGYQDIGRLKAGGIVYSPSAGRPPDVPRFESDGRTQKGTGFNEFTADGRLVLKTPRRDRIVLAAYAYRQFDVPRTDKCPPPEAVDSECFSYEEQFRTLVYGSYRAKLSLPWMQRLHTTVSWQQQRERTLLKRPISADRLTGRDVVSVFGVRTEARTRRAVLPGQIRGQLRYGFDVYSERISSAEWSEFTRVGLVQRSARGKYSNGARYHTAGMFAEADGRASDGRLRLYAGARVGAVAAAAPENAASETLAVRNTWLPRAGHLGAAYALYPNLRLKLNFDRSFRAPNIDDLTSRQQTGPGYQVENPYLRPEYADMVELGLHFTGPFLLDVWFFQTQIRDAIRKARASNASECPASTPSCSNSRTLLKVVNVEGTSRILGVEAFAYANLTAQLTLRLSATLTWGDRPVVTEQETELASEGSSRVPLSRVPPLNGSAELRWHPLDELSIGAALRWAMRQSRLAPQDLYDARIPTGGAPGFAVVDLRVAYRLSHKLLLSLVAENLFDAAYREHGSSINGPGCGLVMMASVSTDAP